MTHSFQHSELQGAAYHHAVQKKQDLERVVLSYLLDHPDQLLGLDRFVLVPTPA